MTVNVHPRDAAFSKKMIAWIIMFSAMCILVVELSSMYQTTPCQREHDEGEKPSPSRTLLSSDPTPGDSIDGERESDRIIMQRYPSVDRPVSPRARRQDGPNCWMYAMASWLRTKQKKLTPHSDLIHQMKEIQNEFCKFWKEFKKLYDANKVSGMEYWMESEWWKLTQSAAMKNLFKLDWTIGIAKKSFPEKVFAQRLMMQKFFNLHGFSFSELRFTKNTDPLTCTPLSGNGEEPVLSDVVRKERALIALSGPSWDIVMRERIHLPPGFTMTREGRGGHMLVLASFDEKTNEYILKDSHGPDVKTKGADEGRIHIPKDLLDQLSFQVFVTKESQLQQTSVEKYGWMWAVAILHQIKQTEDMQCPLEQAVTSVKEQWYNVLSEFAELDVRVDVRQVRIMAIRVFYSMRRLCMFPKLEFPRATATLKSTLEEKKEKHALIRFEHSDWKTMVTKFTWFHQLNGVDSDPGEPQVMVLRGFVLNAHGEGIYELQDTHGLNGRHPAQNDGRMIRIPEEELDSMHFDAWFVKNCYLPIAKDVQEIFSPHTFVAEGKHSSDLQDIYRINFVDRKARQEKWFVINVREEIERHRRETPTRSMRIARSFDVYKGKEMHWSLHCGRIQMNLSIEGYDDQSPRMEFHWDMTEIQVIQIRKLDSKGNVEREV